MPFDISFTMLVAVISSIYSFLACFVANLCGLSFEWYWCCCCSDDATKAWSTIVHSSSSERCRHCPSGSGSDTVKVGFGWPRARWSSRRGRSQRLPQVSQGVDTTTAATGVRQAMPHRPSTGYQAPS